MIKLVLLTGFLGTGKTTLLRQLLEQFSNEKIGVLLNEFGQISIDGILIENKAILTKELNNGSIFCSCIKENFLRSLVELSAEDIDYLFIEASGLADPSNLPQILGVVNALAANRYDYNGSVCVVDAENFLDYYDMLPALHRQVAYSGSILVNKADLAEDSLLSDVLEKLISINPAALIQVTTFCQADYHMLFSELKVLEHIDQETSNTLESRPKTIMLTAEEVLPAACLKKLMTELNEFAYRIKGFAKTDAGIIYISGVRNRLEIEPWKGPFEKSQIVIISAIGIGMVSRITEKLDGELKEKIRINL